MTSETVVVGAWVLSCPEFRSLILSLDKVVKLFCLSLISDQLNY